MLHALRRRLAELRRVAAARSGPALALVRALCEALRAPARLAIRGARERGEARRQQASQQAAVRRRAEQALRESEARFQAMADSAPVLIWVADTTAGCTFFNQPWLEFTGRTMAQELGAGWAEGVHPDDRERCLRTYAEAFAARRPFSTDYRLRRADGEYRWLLDNGAPRFAPDGTFAGFIGSCVDITERHHDEASLRAQHTVAQALAEATAAGAALSRVLATVGEGLGWDWCAMWSLDRQAGALRLAEHWSSLGDGAAALTQASRELVFAPGRGLPGRVWSSGEAIWIADVQAVPGLLRAAPLRALGLRGGMAAPISVGGSFVGVIELFRRAPSSGERRQLETLGAIGAQIGQYLERVEALEALRASEERYRTLVEANPQITWVLTPSGSLDYFNRRWSDYTGLSGEASAGMRWIDVCHPDDRAALVAIRSAAIETGEAYETTMRLRRFDGIYRWHLSRVVPLYEGGRLVAWFGTATDINELKRAEDAQRFLTDATTALAGSLAYETTLAQVAALAVPALADWCIVDLCQDDGSIATVAHAHRDPSRRADVEELMRRYPNDPRAPFGPGRVVRTGEAELVPTVTPLQVAANVRDAGDAARILDLGLRSYLCVPILLEGQACGSIALIASEPGRYGPDQLRLAEELARRAALAIQNARLYREAQEAIAVRDQFLSVASHELKTPLTALLGYAQLLQRRQGKAPSLEARDRRALRTIVSQGERLERLVNLLLDLSRIELGQLKIERAPLDLAALVREAVDELQPALEQHTLALEAPEGPLPLDGDALRLDQMLQNLLQNAVKYSPDGGTIRVRLERRGDDLLLEVSDEGIGIPETALPSLFSRFYRAPNVGPYQISGTGIGLYVVREIVTHHGGTIAVKSVEGVGTTFAVRLPAAGLAAARGQAAHSQGHGP